MVGANSMKACFFNFQIIITRSIFVVDKKITGISLWNFILYKEKLKRGIQNRRELDFQKNHNSLNFCRRQKSYLKFRSIIFYWKKNLKTQKSKKKIVGNFQKIITLKILIVSKNFTFKKMLRISFSIGKKIKKGEKKSKGGGRGDL